MCVWTMVVVVWSAESTCDRVVLGLIPPTKKLFSFETTVHNLFNQVKLP